VAVNKSSQDFIIQQVDLISRMAFDLASLTQDTILLEQAFTLAAINERERLARDLHDSVTQVLFSSTLLAEVLPQIWRRNPEEGLQKLDKLRQLSRGALAEMRTLLLELRPSSLVNTPLADLLLQLAEAVMSRSGLPFQLFIEQIPSLPDTVQTNFYRIAQEALNNIVKHSQAKKVTMSLSATPVIPEPSGALMHEIMLMIQDDGIGYSLGIERPGHLGLGIMKERAAAIHAVLSTESLPGTGTQITLAWRGVKQEPSNE
jgi:signal transduction histidine kinase